VKKVWPYISLQTAGWRRYDPIFLCKQQGEEGMTLYFSANNRVKGMWQWGGFSGFS
jgi:hypothetical protein